MEKTGERWRDRRDRHNRGALVERDAALRLARRADVGGSFQLSRERQGGVVGQRPERALLIAPEDRHDRAELGNRAIARDRPAHESEHRGVAADPERNRDQQRHRQTWRVREAPGRVPEVREGGHAASATTLRLYRSVNAISMVTRTGTG